MTDMESNKGVSSPIKKFYENANIFVTGGTGFLGMLLIEKLLFSCPDISHIYMLVRSKKGKGVQSRLRQLFDDEAFYRLRETDPDFEKKIVPIEGDCELPNLGLNAQDRMVLIKEVNIIFHAAATVRFDSPLKKAAFINVRAVRDMVYLAKDVENLKSFVHISTAYSNCIHNHIKEEFYPPSIEYKKFLSVTEGLSEDILSVVTPMLLGDYPNTYSFTKQIGEDVIRQEGVGLPVGIHRPSIVISSYREPLKGWINNVYGPSGLILAGGLGMGKAAYLDNRFSINVVPADLGLNSMIASAWDIAEGYTKGSEDSSKIPIYNFEGSEAAQINWDYMVKTCLKYAEKYNTVHAIWHMCYIPCSNYVVYVFFDFFVHVIPAFMADAVLFCMGKKPMMMNVYRKMNGMYKVLHYFMFREWTFESNNVAKLKSRMSAEDRVNFFCEMKGLDWDEYFHYYVIGIRQFLLKDPLDTVPAARKKARRLYWIHQFTKGILGVLLLWILWSIVSLIFRYIVG